MHTSTYPDEVISQYIGGKSLDYIAREHNTHRHRIAEWLKLRGVATRPPRGRSRYQLNHNAFDDTSSEAVQYWTGFLMADGCVSLPGPGETMEIKLELGAVDREHVEAFRTFIGTDKPIRSFRRKSATTDFVGEYVCLRVRSDPMAAALAAAGVVPRKTHTAAAGPNKDSRHFWRGVVDGDGCLTYRRNESGDYPALSLCGTRQLTEDFAQFVFRNHGFLPAVRCYAPPTCVVHVQCSKARTLAHWLYSDASIALHRKREKAMAF